MEADSGAHIVQCAPPIYSITLTSRTRSIVHYSKGLEVEAARPPHPTTAVAMFSRRLPCSGAPPTAAHLTAADRGGGAPS